MTLTYQEQMSRGMPRGTFDSMSDAPTAAAYGVGPAWIGGVQFWSDGADWSTARQQEYQTPANSSASANRADIQSFIDDAGAGAVLVFDPRQTYTIDRALVFKQYQRVTGLNVKRENQRSSTLAASYTQGSGATITVADLSQFAVGDYVCIEDRTDTGSNPNKRVYLKRQPITSMSGSSGQGTLTLSGAPDIGSASCDWTTGNYHPVYNVPTTTSAGYVFAIGSVVSVVFDTVQYDLGTCFYRCNIDGNKSNFTHGNYWDILSEIHAIETIDTIGFNEFIGLRIHDFPGEGIQESATIDANLSIQYLGDFNSPDQWQRYDARYRDCYIYSGNGNGIHFSTCNFALVEGCHFSDLNLDITVGHVGGACCVSYMGAYTTIRNNLIERCFAGYSRLLVSSHGWCSFTGNIVRDTNQFGFFAYASTTSYDLFAGISVDDNHFINAGTCVIAGGNGAATSAGDFRSRHVSFCNNRMVGTRLLIVRLGQTCKVDRNTIDTAFVPPIAIGNVAAISTSATSVTPSTTTGLFSGMRVYIAKHGKRSTTRNITTISGGIVTFDGAIGTDQDGAALPANSYIVQADRMSVWECTTGTITSGSTSSITVDDTTGLNVGQYIAIGSLTGGSSNVTTYRQVTSIDTSTGAVGIAGTFDKSLTPGSGNSAVHIFKASDTLFSTPEFGAAALEYSSLCTITNNTIIGSYYGAQSYGVSGGPSVAVYAGNLFQGQRQGGLQCGTTAYNENIINGNVVDGTGSYSRSDWYGIRASNKCKLGGNRVFSNQANQIGIQFEANCVAGAVSIGDMALRSTTGGSGASIKILSGAANVKISASHVTTALTDAGTSTINTAEITI